MADTLTKDAVLNLAGQLMELAATHPDLAEESREPVAVMLVFNSGEYMKAGTRDRDRTATSKALIEMAADEIGGSS